MIARRTLLQMMIGAVCVTATSSCTGGSRSSVDVTGLVENAITGWWIDPPAMGMEGITYFGAAGSDGSVLVNAVGESSSQSVRVARSGVDDHNGPAVWAESGVPLVTAWSLHNADRLVRVRVGGIAGSSEALSFGPEFTLELGGTVSYAKLFRVGTVLSSNSWRFKLLVRVRYDEGGKFLYTWSVCNLLVDKGDNSVQWQGKEETLFASTNNRVPYLSAVQGGGENRTVRLAIGYHPVTSGDQAPIRYATYDLVDDTVYNASGVLMWSLNDGLSRDRIDRRLGYVVGPTASGSMRRRFLGVAAGPSAPAVLYAEWELSNENQGSYMVASEGPVGELWTASSLGPAGVRFGHSDTANYVSGACFNGYPRVSPDVIIVRNMGQACVIERCSPGSVGWLREEIATLPYIVARPIASVAGGSDGVIVSRIETYGDEAGGFKEFSGQVVSLHE